jgi:hypothetical protein
MLQIKTVPLNLSVFQQLKTTVMLKLMGTAAAAATT